jgi:hypothetical protein
MQTTMLSRPAIDIGPGTGLDLLHGTRHSRSTRVQMDGRAGENHTWVMNNDLSLILRDMRLAVTLQGP